MKHVLTYIILLSSYWLYGQWELTSDTLGNPVFKDFQFINQDTGYVVGNINSEGVVFRTYNGGLSWDTIVVEYTPGTFTGSFTPQNVYFPSDSIGYLLNSVDILKTNDGGSTWYTVDTGDVYIQSMNQRDILFINNDTGYVCWGDGGAGGLRTFDGGLTWEDDPVLSLGALKFNEFDGRYTAAGAGWFNLNTNLLYWNVFDPISYGWYHYTDCININGRIIVVGSKMGQSGEGIFSYTDDFGNSWTGKECPASLDGICFFNENLGFVYGWMTGAWKTDDGGETWYETSVETNGMNTTTSFKKIQMLNDTLGFAISANGIYQDGLYKTINAGGTGQEVTFLNQYLSSKESVQNIVSVYPNPAVDKISIQGLDLTGFKVEIYNIYGSLVSFQTNETNQIDVSKLASGIYFLNIRSSNESYELKFIKE